jgi:type IV fimbrial biogenesis protein FimT
MLKSLREGGFTLIELMITLVIVAIVITLGLPGIMQWMQNSQIRTAAESVQNGLVKARIEAVRRNTLVEFALTSHGVPGGTGWTIRTANDNVVIESLPDGVGSRNVILSTFPEDTWTVTFNGFGRVPTAPAVNADGSPFLTTVDIDNPIIDAADSRELRVVIPVGGEVRMCDPNVVDTLDPRRC